MYNLLFPSHTQKYQKSSCLQEVIIIVTDEARAGSVHSYQIYDHIGDMTAENNSHTTSSFVPLHESVSAQHQTV